MSAERSQRGWDRRQIVIKVLRLSVACLSLFFGARGSRAQTGAPEGPPTLTSQLLKEDAQVLAQAAREKGDSVQGAILFSQKEFNCVGCHAQGAKDLLGPDLTKVRSDSTASPVSDSYFVESILSPSKVIHPEFQSVTLLLLDGRIIRGRVIEQDEKRMVIRDTSEASRLVSIGRAQIDQQKVDVKSAMPEGLANQLADRQAFLDLVKYVMELSATGSESGPIPVSALTGGKQPDDLIRGLVLLETRGCTQCHAPIKDRSALRHSGVIAAPDLKSAASRIDPSYLRRFIADPHEVKPGTRMPNVMGHLDPAAKQVAAMAISTYLRSLTDQSFERQAIDMDAAKRGEAWFHAVGCVACHAPRDSQGREKDMSDSVPLGDLSAKYSTVSLASFLRDPHAVRPSGEMPNMQLSHWESVDLANYLLQDASKAPVTSESVVAEDLGSENEQVAEGRRYFKELGCVQCHSHGESSPPPKAKSLATLDLSRGCLSSDSGSWPAYHLDPAQVKILRLAIENLSQPLTDAQRISLTLTSLRCYACHQRDGVGGIPDDRDSYFATSNQNLGPQGRIPPTLTRVGAKLKPKWLRQVLVSGRSIRPYMMTRMPQYEAAHVTELLELLPKVDVLPKVELKAPADRKEFKKIGTELVGKDGLNCIACHTFQEKDAQTMPAVDLTEMAERLKPDWFYHYMRAPQTMSLNTVMPSFWPGGKAIRDEILDGEVDQQISAVWEYLQDGRQARVPRGLRFEPIELLATEDRAVMLRRSYRGIGKRGIGVGYPLGVNVAFDAEQLRIGTLWKGKFADPGGVWRGQGHGTVRPLGSELVQFRSGPELDEAETPWIVDEGRPPHHRFTGYFLDNQARPTFTYRWKNIAVEDSIVDEEGEVSGETRLTRTVTFDAPQPNDQLVFRLRAVEPMSESSDSEVRVGSKLVIRTDHGHPGEVVHTDEGDEFRIPLRLPRGKSKLILQYKW